jgi:hypothetical protein
MRIFALALFLLAAIPFTNASDASSTAAPANSPVHIQLEKNWHIQSACKVNDGGAAISHPE